MLRLNFVPLRATTLVVLVGTVVASMSPVSALNVKYDLGGSLEQRRQEIAVLRAQKQNIRIDGLCVSACTLYLGEPRACVTEDAQLGFHGPLGFAGFPLSKEQFDFETKKMAAHYPPKLRRWFMKTGRHILHDYYVLSGAEVIAMGVERC